MAMLKENEKNKADFVGRIFLLLKNTRRNYDYFIGALFSVFVFFLFVLTDFTESWYGLTRRYEYLELDELLGLLMGLLFGVLWITFTRIKRARTLAQRSALESDVRLHTIADQSPSVIFLKDTQGRFTFVNKSFQRLHGCGEEQTLGKTVFDFLSGPEAETAARLDLAVIKEGRAVESEIVVPRADGDRFFAAIRFPIRDPLHGLMGIGGIDHDITERKQAEKEALSGKEAAELANRAKSEFLANMSHELRTPLNAIIGFSSVMMGEINGQVENAEDRSYAKDIYVSGCHLLEIINDILDFSKIESAVEKLNEEEIEVAEIVRSVRTIVTHRAEKGGVAFKIENHLAAPSLRADRRKLKQILINLLINAIKFTRPGGEVTLKIFRGAEGEHIFEVIDTGIGMAPEDIPKAFAPFEQIDSDLNRRYEGTGLGLPLAKALTALHGGSLQLQSVPGSGTTATVRLPAPQPPRSAVSSPGRA